MSVITSTKYVWAHRGGSKALAQRVGEAVERIAERDGCCPPEALVDAARPASSPLHSAFEWDNKTAAESWRKYQARSYINSIRISGPDGEVAAGPAFVHVRVLDDRQGYALTSIALQDEEQHSFVLAEALRGLRGYRRRYNSLRELEGVWQALDEAEDAVEIDKSVSG